MPADIDQLLDAAAAEPTRPPDVGALRARARRARRRERILTGGGALAVLALAVTVLTAGGDVVQLRPGDGTAGPRTGAARFAITATAQPDAALVGVHVEVTDPGEVTAGETAQHALTVTVADSPVNLTGVAHLDQTVRQPDGGALQVLGVCADGDERAPACPDAAELVATADTPRRIPLRLRTDDLTAGTYQLAASVSAADDAAPAPPIHLTYTVVELAAPGGDGAAPADPELQPSDTSPPDPVPFSMYVHCGVEAAQIDGRWWEVIEPLYRDGQPGLGPPAGWSDPYQEGVLTRLGPELAEFRADHGAVVQLRPRNIDVPPRICR